MSKTIYLFRHSEPADVYSSPYLRAVQTAEAFGMKVSVDDRLHERTIGRPEAFTKDLWELQYHDRALKLAGGESNAQDRCFRLFGHLHLCILLFCVFSFVLFLRAALFYNFYCFFYQLFNAVEFIVFNHCIFYHPAAGSAFAASCNTTTGTIPYVPSCSRI